MKLLLSAWKSFLQHYGRVFMATWRVRKSLDAKGFSPAEAEFLPAALALQETPLSPAPRVAMWLLISFALIALLWAVFGKIDVVATATGKIIPNQGSKTIQSLTNAQVKAIHVQDGQSVKAGEVLIELDATIAAADQERYTKELAAAQVDILRSRALLKALESNRSPKISARIETSYDPSRIEEAQRLADGQYQEYLSKRAQLSADMAHREAELQSTQAAVNRLQQTVPIAQQRAKDYKDLVEKNFISKHGWLDKEQTRLEQEGELAVQKSRLHEIDATLVQARHQRQSLEAETRRTTLDLLNESLRKQDILQQELNKAQSNTESLRLTAPVDGTVQQLAVHTIGGVVTAAQPLMMIVPKDNPIEIEAMLENKDIGFVQARQIAAVKVETFPYTKYGTIPATVFSVSEDAINDEKRGLIYQAKVRLERATIQVEGKTVRLSPGMAVTVEIKTGQRRVIEYFLSPLIQHTSESLRER